METKYVMPELELIGNASEIVQGVLSIGPDPGGQSMVNGFEFEED